MAQLIINNKKTAGHLCNLWIYTYIRTVNNGKAL